MREQAVLLEQNCVIYCGLDQLRPLQQLETSRPSIRVVGDRSEMFERPAVSHGRLRPVASSLGG
eukprot:4896286-Pyramimonas_sp.AAC.1